MNKQDETVVPRSETQRGNRAVSMGSTPIPGSKEASLEKKPHEETWSLF